MPHGLMDKLIFVAIACIIACICAGVVIGVWLAIRAVCRKLGLGRGYQIFIPSGVCGVPFILLLVASVDRLGPLERTCRDELLKTTRMEDTTDLRIEEHYDFWTKTISGGGWVSPWISRPYETPKVSLKVNFTRDRRPHSAWIDCIFSKIPNTGEPPQLTMHDVKFEYENVLEQTSGNQSTWVPWHPHPKAR
jgi:hypothetical protein